MEMRLAAHDIPLSMPHSSGCSDWRDSRLTHTFQASVPMMQASEPHYNYVDPSPSTFASPTGSSPSASPQHPERRPHSATFPLFLAQHTSAAPITVEPLDANNSGWPPSSSDNLYSPPSRYNFVSTTGYPVTSMEFMPSHASNYPFPAQHDDGHFGMHRRRLSMLAASQLQMQAPHLYDSGNPTYGMMVQEREQYHEATDGRRHFVQEREDWPQHGHPFYPHYEAAPLPSRLMQPQLLLATTMPASTPIVMDEPSLMHSNHPVYHQYDVPSQADPSASTHTFEVSTTAFRSSPPSFPVAFTHRAHEPTEVYAYASAPAPHSDVRSRYRTNMDIWSTNHHEGSSILTARPAAPHPAQPHSMQDGEPMILSPTQQQGRGENVHKFAGNVPMYGAVVSPGQGAIESDSAEGSKDQRQHYAPIGNYEIAENLQRNAPTAPISDRSEPYMGINATNRPSSNLAVEVVDERKRDGEDDQQRKHAGSEQLVHIKQSPHSSPVDISTTRNIARFNLASDLNDSVAVAPLQQFTAPDSEKDTRFERGDHDRRVNGEGAVGSTNVVYGTGTIKTPESKDDRNPSQTISEASVHTIRSNIDRSSSLPLQTTSATESAANVTDMQVISPSSYPQSQESQGYTIAPIHPFPTFNQHLPTIPSLLRPEWRRSSNSEYSTGYHQHGGDSHVAQSPRKHSFDYDDALHGRSMPPIHRNSLPNLPPAAEHRSPQEIASAHPSPSQAAGYYTPGERLVPAAFGDRSSSQGSGSSASSTPPTVLHDASANHAPVYRYEPTVSSQMPHSSQTVTYGSPRDQKLHYEPAYPTVFHPAAASPPYGSRGQVGMYYGAYPPEFGRAAPAYPRHYDHHVRGSSSSPAPPMIAGTKRGREDDWAEDTEAGRELLRRRSSYSKSTAMMVGGLAYRTNPVSGSPLLPTAEMGVIRVAGYVPSLQEMGVRDVTGEPPNAGIERYANGRTPGEDAIRSGSDTSYSFISLPGNTVRKRPRRKFEEITRNYICIWPGCSKAYGTLNHLNAHVTMQKHGTKRVPSEFKELRKVWRKQKREQQLQHQLGHAPQIDEGSEFYPDEDQENAAEDDEGSVYNPTVESTQ